MILSAVLGLSSSLLAATSEGTHLFILSGQSNMVGLKPNASFTPTVQKAFGKSSVLVVHDAKGGQPIRRWYKGWKPEASQKPEQIGDLYDRLMKKVKDAVKNKAVSSATFVWMQGERDAKEQLSDKYEESFNGLLAQIKKDLGIDKLNFVIGRLSDFDMKNAKYKHWTKVRDAQVKLAESSPNGAWVDTDDLNNKGEGEKKKDDLHYTKDGYVTLGQRFAEKAIQLLK